MRKSLKYFYSSFIIAAIGFIAAVGIGGIQALFITVILAILEISLSFDNAIVNAKVLKDMDEKWKRRFLTWGMLIAVFGMRLIFPVLIVSIVAGLTPWDAFTLAVRNPDEYAHALESAHIVISGFGGAFLLMVFLKFFFDVEKDVHWVRWVEKQLVKVARLESAEIILALVIALVVAQFVHTEERSSFLMASILGIVGFLCVKGLEGLLQHKNHAKAGAEIAKAGLATFIYLEVLDASFSFDGVIGAFALSKNIYIIMIGLGIGAMFVRSLTLFFVGHGTLSKFKYLEHGAFWAIGVLAAIMFVSTFYHVPEVITGILGAVLIVLALFSSLRIRKTINEVDSDDVHVVADVA